MAWIWLGLALLVLVAELLSGTIFLLFVSLGMFLPAVVLFLWPDAALAVQLLIFSVVALIGLVVYIRSRKRKRFRKETGYRANYRGSGWNAALDGSTDPLVPGRYCIKEVRGTVLIVEPVASQKSSA